MKNKTISRILLIQVGWNIALSLFLHAPLEKYYDYFFKGAGNFLLVLQIGLLLVALIPTRRISISAIFLPYIFLLIHNLLFSELIKNFAKYTTLIYVVYFIGMLFILVPVAVSEYGKIKNTFLRLLALFWLGRFSISLCFISLSYARTFTVSSKYDILNILNNSLLVSSLLIPISFFFLLRTWGYRFYFNLKVTDASKKYYLILFLSIGFFIWYILFSIFSGLAQYPSQMFNNWDLSLINPQSSTIYHGTLEVILNSLRPAIFEESERYAYLLLLLVVFKDKKFQIEYSVLLSALIWGVGHFINIFDPLMTSTSMVVSQVVTTTAMGLFLGALLLYSGKWWLCVVLHFMNDFLISSVTSLASISVELAVFSEKWGSLVQAAMLSTIVLIASIIFFEFGKRTIKKNAEMIINVN